MEPGRILSSPRTTAPCCRTGSTEQHAQLSLSVDCILSERVAVDAAEPLGVPVFPAVTYGLTPYFLAFPGTVTLQDGDLSQVVSDILDCLAAGLQADPDRQRPWRQPAGRPLAHEWMADNPGVAVKFHNWWNAPKTWKKVKEIDPVASHASWMENFPWTRLAGAEHPTQQKPMVDFDTHAADVAARRSRPFSATAISAATTRGRTRR